jgi:O-antigen/teichoic acid export membrane protein
MLEKAVDLKNNKDFMGTIFVTSGSLIGSVFAYLLQFFLGRTLSVSDYGTFNALLSLMYLINTPAVVFGLSLVKRVSVLSSEDNFKKLTTLFWKMFVFAFIFGFFIFSLVFIFKGLIANFLNIGDLKLIVFFGLFLALSSSNIVPMSYLQGLLRYKAFGFSSVINGFYRFTLAGSAALLGYGLYGVFGGMTLSVILAFLTGLFLLSKNLTKFQNLNVKSEYRQMVKFMLPVFFVNFGMMFLNNIDLILVKRFFEADQAGYYAGTVTLGKILLFGAGTITIVMFPRVSALFSKGEDHMKVFKFLTYLQLSVVFIGIFCFSMFPKLITHLFFGSRFNDSIKFLPLFSVFIGFYILVNYFITYLLAIERTKVFLFLIPAILLQFVLLNMFHQTIYMVIGINISIAVLLLVGLVSYSVYVTKHLKSLVFHG